MQRHAHRQIRITSSTPATGLWGSPSSHSQGTNQRAARYQLPNCWRMQSRSCSTCHMTWVSWKSNTWSVLKCLGKGVLWFDHSHLIRPANAWSRHVTSPWEDNEGDLFLDLESSPSAGLNLNYLIGICCRDGQYLTWWAHTATGWCFPALLGEDFLGLRNRFFRIIQSRLTNQHLLMPPLNQFSNGFLPTR
jgi:hypothetical protein